MADPRRVRGLKKYDRAYFDRWYRDSRYAVVREGVVRRRIGLAVSVAEYLLERPIRSVLDVGCGEAPWRACLLKMRPGVRYLGVDSSEYAVRKYGRRRNLQLGTVGGLARMGIRGRFDLVVCSDVLHYVPTGEVRAGLRAIASMLRGVAFLETFALEDDIEGDKELLQQRSESTYRRLFREAGLFPVGLHCYVGSDVQKSLTAFERPAPARRAGPG